MEGEDVDDDDRVPVLTLPEVVAEAESNESLVRSKTS